MVGKTKNGNGNMIGKPRMGGATRREPLLNASSSSSPPSAPLAVSKLPQPVASTSKPLKPVPNITPSKFRPFLPGSDGLSGPSLVSQIEEDSPIRPPPASNSNKGDEGSSQIQNTNTTTTTTQESEKTDFSGSKIRKRDWGSVGYKAREREQDGEEGRKKRTALSEILQGRNAPAMPMPMPPPPPPAARATTKTLSMEEGLYTNGADKEEEDMMRFINEEEEIVPATASVGNNTSVEMVGLIDFVLSCGGCLL